MNFIQIVPSKLSAALHGDGECWNNYSIKWWSAEFWWNGPKKLLIIQHRPNSNKNACNSRILIEKFHICSLIKQTSLYYFKNRVRKHWTLFVSCMAIYTKQYKVVHTGKESEKYLMYISCCLFVFLYRSEWQQVSQVSKSWLVWQKKANPSFPARLRFFVVVFYFVQVLKHSYIKIVP